MPRIRSIKPEMFGDEKLSPMSVLDRFVFVGLISMADDAGRLLDSARAIDGFIFPLTNDTCRRSLDHLAASGVILRYASASGQRLLQVVGWKKHQRIEKPNPHTLPGPADILPDDSGKIPGMIGEQSRRTSSTRHPPDDDDDDEEGVRSTIPDQRSTTAAARPSAGVGGRQGEAFALLGERLTPAEAERAWPLVADALPPTSAGRDLLLDVLRAAATGPDDPGLYLRAMHNTLDPVGGHAATAAQLAVALDEWLTKRRAPGVRGFVGFVQRAYVKAPPAQRPAEPVDALGPIPAGRDGAFRRTYRNAMLGTAPDADAPDPSREVFPPNSHPPRLTRGAA